MSFIDELNSVIKSPDEVKNQKQQERVDFGIRCATQDYQKLKERIMNAAKRNEYELVNGKKIIECQCDCSFWNGIRGKESRIVGFEPAYVRKVGNLYLDTGIKFYIKDQVAFDSYKATIQKSASEDGISFKIVTQYCSQQYPFPTTLEKVSDVNATNAMSSLLYIVLIGKVEL